MEQLLVSTTNSRVTDQIFLRAFTFLAMATECAAFQPQVERENRLPKSPGTSHISQSQQVLVTTAK